MDSRWSSTCSRLTGSLSRASATFELSPSMNSDTHQCRRAQRATFVSINNDTLYSIAQIDLSVGPVRLDVPNSLGPYHVLQFVDAWTNNFAYVGHRSTGTGAGSFLLAPPGTHTQPPVCQHDVRHLQ